jgi:hypothetical protein
MNHQTQLIPFGATFAGEPVIINKVDPRYSGETQIAENASDLDTDTYLKWTEDSDK